MTGKRRIAPPGGALFPPAPDMDDAIHEPQKERGIPSGFAASHGAAFSDRLRAQRLAAGHFPLDLQLRLRALGTTREVLLRSFTPWPMKSTILVL